MLECKGRCELGRAFSLGSGIGIKSESFFCILQQNCMREREYGYKHLLLNLNSRWRILEYFPGQTLFSGYSLDRKPGTPDRG
jgi:hypothetical protein